MKNVQRDIEKKKVPKLKNPETKREKKVMIRRSIEKMNMNMREKKESIVITKETNLSKKIDIIIEEGIEAKVMRKKLEYTRQPNKE